MKLYLITETVNSGTVVAKYHCRIATTFLTEFGTELTRYSRYFLAKRENPQASCFESSYMVSETATVLERYMYMSIFF